MMDVYDGATCGGALAAGNQREPQDHGEEWRDIPGFPSYQASSLGRLMSFRRDNPRILKPTTCRDGHLQVELFNDCKRWKVRVGTVVSLAFNGPCPPGSVVKHRDGDRHNNATANLCCMPAASAIRRDFSTGRHPTKLNTESVAALRVGGCLAHLPAKVTARLFGVAEGTIRKVRKGLSWAWVPGATNLQDSRRAGNAARAEKAVTGASEPSRPKVTVSG